MDKKNRDFNLFLIVIVIIIYAPKINSGEYLCPYVGFRRVKGDPFFSSSFHVIDILF